MQQSYIGDARSEISIRLLDYIAVHAMTPYSHVAQKSCILDRYYVTVMHTKVR